MQPPRFPALAAKDFVAPIFVLIGGGGVLASKWLGAGSPEASWLLRLGGWFVITFGIAWGAALQSGDLRSRASDFLFGSDLENSTDRFSRRDYSGAAKAAVFFLALLVVLLFKNVPNLKSLFDIHWHMAFLDYDVVWHTPRFSLAGNILYHFDMQVPFNTNLAPLNGVVRLFRPEYRVAASFTLVALATAALLWAIGQAAGLRPVARTIFACLTALIVTMPYGFDHLLPFLPPPFLFMSQAMLTSYWGEVGVLSLTTSLLFFWIGQRQSFIANTAIGLTFAASCYIGLLAYPATAFFSVLVVALYCLAFLATVTNAKEFWWKAGTGAAVLASMLAAHIPLFFRNLYSYSLGAYFPDQVMNSDRLTIWRYSTMTSAFSYDPNFVVVAAISFACAFYFVVRGYGALRRIAISMLFFEMGIIAVGAVVAYLHYPISLYYSDQMQAPIVAGFFVLALMFTFVVFFNRGEELFLGLLQKSGDQHLLPWVLQHRRTIHAATFVLILAVSPFRIPKERPYDNSQYPPAKPPSVQILDNELALRPGKAFGGRALTLVQQDFPPQRGPTMAPLLNAVLDVLEEHYGRYTGNDHWIDLLHLNIPVVGEYAEWTTPINFIFLREFFGRKDDMFEKALFVLRTYDERVARMIGIRYVITDAASAPGGTLVYERMAGDTPLRLFRIDDTNLGQYSPTKLTRIATAAEGIVAIKKSAFDPRQDAVVEDDLPANVVPGTLQSLTVEAGPALHVRAESPGSSLLVLPFEYSHCLRLKTADGGATARLVPVNLQQTGLVFDRHADVEITYSFGPLAQPACRGDDLARMDRLHLRDAL